MKQKSKALSIGLGLIIFNGVAIFLERLTDWGISKHLGRLYCGARYLQFTGQPGDGTCGFNMDMVVGMTCFLLIVIGLFLVLIAFVKKIVNRRKNRSA